MTPVDPELRKAAIVVLSLPPVEAVELIARLEPAEAAALREAIAHCGPISGDELQAVTRELAEQEQAHAAHGPFDYLQTIDSQQLLPFLAEERPATIALVLAHLPRWKATRVAAGLSQEIDPADPPDLDALDPQIVADVADELRLQLAPLLDEPRAHRPARTQPPHAKAG